MVGAESGVEINNHLCKVENERLVKVSEIKVNGSIIKIEDVIEF